MTTALVITATVVYLLVAVAVYQGLIDSGKNSPTGAFAGAIAWPMVLAYVIAERR